MKINKGEVINGVYIKKVSFASAVLWKDKQLSLPPDVFKKVIHCKEWRFVDIKKGETWIFDPWKVVENAILKKEGQESQYYFPIQLAKKEVYAKKISKVAKVPDNQKSLLD